MNKREKTYGIKCNTHFHKSRFEICNTKLFDYLIKQTHQTRKDQELSTISGCATGQHDLVGDMSIPSTQGLEVCSDTCCKHARLWNDAKLLKLIESIPALHRAKTWSGQSSNALAKPTPSTNYIDQTPVTSQQKSGVIDMNMCDIRKQYVLD